MRLGIDIDDTISDTYQIVMEYAKNFTKQYCHREYNDIEKRLGNIETHYYIQEVFEWNTEEEEAFFKQYYRKFIDAVKPKEDAQKILQELYCHHEIILITARWEDEKDNGIKEATKRWLEQYQIPYNKLYLNRPKLEVCKENKINVFIDDSYVNCKSVQSDGIKTYMMDCKSNQNIEDDSIERVYNWNDIYEKLKKYEGENANGNYYSYRS